MRKNNLKNNTSTGKAADVMQQISQEGIVGNGKMNNVSDGSVQMVSDETFDNYEESLLADHNSKVDEQMAKWDESMKELNEQTKALLATFKDIDIRPLGMYILVKPYEKNPFTRMKQLDNGFIVPEFDPHYKSQDTGEIEEMQRMSIFAIVVEVSPDTKGIKKGDIVMYNRHEGVPIPFYGQGFEAVAWTHIKCVIGNHDDLEARWKGLKE